MIVVSDTIPLISLLKVSHLDVLQKLYGDILPEAVLLELTFSSDFANESEDIKKCEFIKVVSVGEHYSVHVLQKATGLNIGESEAIIYADTNKADLLLMDEIAGRRVAKSMSLC